MKKPKLIRLSTILRPSPIWLVMLNFLVVSAMHLEAMIITTNCTDSVPSIALPKRVQASCPSLGSLTFYFVPSQSSTTDGFDHVFGGPGFYGLAHSDTNGTLSWKIALTNGTIAPGNAPGRFGAFQDLPSGVSNVACFGVYDYSAGSFVPVFEKRLPINSNRFVSHTTLNNGIYILAINRSDSVSLLGLNSNGTLLWAKQLTSTDFPYVNSGDPSDPGRSVDVNESGATNFLLTVDAVEEINGTNTAETVLARFDSNGGMQWARKINIPSISGPIFSVTPSGETLLVLLDFGLIGGNSVSFTYLAKVATNGTLAWSRQFVGGSYLSGPFQMDTQGSLLLGLGSEDASFDYLGVCCVLNTNGQVTSLLQINPPLAGLVSPQAVSLAAGKIYFAGSSGETPIVGSSSLALNDFTAEEYTKGPLGGPSLSLLQDGRLVFLGAETNDTTTDLLFLNSNLVEQADCTFFTGSTLNTSGSTITVVTNSPSFSSITVASSNLSLTLASTQLHFQTMAFQEESLCSTNCEFSLSSAGASLGVGAGSTNVNVMVTSGSGCDWIVSNPCATWITVSPTNGTGNVQVTINVSSNDTGVSRNCTLTIAGKPFDVTQTVSPGGIGFDDLPSSITGWLSIPDGYGGLTWINLFVVNGVGYPNGGGFGAGVVSASNVVYNGYEYYNGYEDVAAVTAGSPFNLISAYLTAAWNDNQQFVVVGYTGSTLTYTNIYTLSATNPTLINFNYFGVNAVYFGTFGGTHHPGYIDYGEYFVMDNMIVSTNPAIIDFPPQSLSVSNGLFQFLLTGPENASVILERSTTLTNWTPIATNTLLPGGWPLSLPTGTNAKQFYRARLGP